MGVQLYITVQLYIAIYSQMTVSLNVGFLRASTPHTVYSHRIRVRNILQLCTLTNKGYS